jgi:hypothetical protein
MDFSEARDAVREFSRTVGVKAPNLVISKKIKGRNSCYNALRHRIDAGQELMSDAATTIRVILAHEVGHVTQRWTTLRDILLCAAITIALGVAIVVASVHETHRGRIPILTAATLLAVMFSWAALMVRWLENTRLNQEFEADAVAAHLCGNDSALAVLRSLNDGSSEIARRVARMESTCAAAVAYARNRSLDVSTRYTTNER